MTHTFVSGHDVTDLLTHVCEVSRLVDLRLLDMLLGACRTHTQAHPYNFTHITPCPFIIETGNREPKEVETTILNQLWTTSTKPHNVLSNTITQKLRSNILMNQALFPQRFGRVHTDMSSPQKDHPA